MNSLWLIHLIFAFVQVASGQKLCTTTSGTEDENQELKIKQCMAHCLDIIDPEKTSNAGLTACSYNSLTGKSKGCGEISHSNVNNKVVICEAGPAEHGSIEELRLCDIVYYTVFSLNPTSDVISVSEQAKTIMENAYKFRNVGVKIIGDFLLWDSAVNMMRISASADLREKLAASISDAVERLQLDGLYLRWMWPGCPMGENCKSASPHKGYTSALLTAIGKALKRSGKLFTMLVPCSPFIAFQLEDYYSDITPHVDYFIMETNNLAGHWNKKPDMNFNLKITKEGMKTFLSKVKNPGFSKKVVISFNPSILSFELKSPTTDNKLYSIEHNPNGKKYSKYLKLPEWCKLVRPGSGYKVFNNIETQNYAIKEDHVFVYDDVQSLKEKVVWLNSFGIGVHIRNTFADDPENVCGCGKLPFLKKMVQLLKSNDCDPFSCF